MQDLEQAEDILLRAIADLRESVNRLIDEQVARVEGWTVEVDRSAPVQRVEGATPIPSTAPRTRRPTVEPARATVLEPPVEERAADPRQRLDALAKRLDGRRKHGPGTGTGSERSGRSVEK